MRRSNEISASKFVIAIRNWILLPSGLERQWQTCEVHFIHQIRHRNGLKSWRSGTLHQCLQSCDLKTSTDLSNLSELWFVAYLCTVTFVVRINSWIIAQTSPKTFFLSPFYQQVINPFNVHGKTQPQSTILTHKHDSLSIVSLCPLFKPLSM